MRSTVRTRIARRAWLRGAASSLVALGLTPRRAQAAPAAPPSTEPQARAVRHARINLALNESPFGPSPRVTRALNDALHGLERYTTSDEASALTRQIAELERVPESQVVLGEILEPLGLYLGLRGGPGGEFVYSEPGYTALVDAARPVGGIGVPVPLDARLENDLPQLQAKLGARTRAVFLVNPHNPSGTLSDAASFKVFVGELAKQTLVVVDEAYLEYADDFAERTLVSRVRAGDNVVVFRTFSKIHGLAALPLGYAIAPLVLAEAMRKQGLGSPRSLNRLAVRAASASLGDPAHLANVRRTVAAERARWHRVLDDLKLRHTDARGNFVFFQAQKPQAELATALMSENIDIGRAFPPLLQWTRISIGLPADNLRVQTALRKLLA